MTSQITNVRRTVKNVAYNYSDAQVKVREATSNDPWGPSSSLMSEVAELTYNAMAFSDIMQMIWKRLNDHGKNWRHVYKSLVLLDYLIKTGSEKVAQQCKENIYAIQTLKDFQHIEDNKDQGMNVREKAKQLVSLLKDDERLKNERARALMAKKRFTQNSVGISSDGSTTQMRPSGTFGTDDPPLHDAFNSRPPYSQQTRFRRGEGGNSGSNSNNSSSASTVMRRGASIPNLTNSELEEARPTSSGEEELQLQIALALSKEEADKDHEAAKGDDIRLKMALEKSQQEGGPTKQDAMADLLGLDGGGGTSTSSAAAGGMASNDPWGGAPSSAVTNDDPWAPTAAASLPGPPPSIQNDPWAPAAAAAQPPPANDPWGGSSQATTTTTQQQPDPFAPQSTPQAATNGTNGNDPWNLEPLGSGLDGMDLKNGGGGMMMGGGIHNGDDGLMGLSKAQQLDADRKANAKTPETFLGENGKLVNLDNLMGPSKPVTTLNPGNSTNPFAAGGAGGPAAAASASTTPNPFTANQRPSPTLAQLQQQQMGGGSGQAEGDWTLPQPLMPQQNQQSSQSPTPNNPFL